VTNLDHVAAGVSAQRSSFILSALELHDAMRTFDNEWIFQPFEDHASFFTRSMFGGLAAYVFGRQMMVLVEPTKTGRWKWHGVLLCTEYEHQTSIVKESGIWRRTTF
jgi:hypothetical protein